MTIGEGPIPATRPELAEELEKVWGFEPSDLWNFTASTMRFMVRDLRASEDSVTG